MITLYTWSTPNGRKVSIMLEECGLPYAVRPVNIGNGDQHRPEFLKLSPNNKIPAITDDEAPGGPGGGPLALFESGAILHYLADKTGRFLAPSGPERWAALQWLHWQIGGLGPMLGQLGFFALRAPEKVPLAVDRFVEEADRLLKVLERRLAAVPFLAGDGYSIADIACFTWTSGAVERMGEPLADTLAAVPHVTAWLATVGARPAVRKGMAVP